MSISQTENGKNEGHFATYEEWYAAMELHPILRNEYRNMEKMYTKLCEKSRSASQEKEWFAREYQQVYGSSRYGLDVLFRRFGQLKAQLATEERAMGDALLLPVWSRLLPNSQIAATTNPVTLLRFAFAHEGGGVVGVRGQMEAITQYILVRLMLSVDEIESEVDGGEDMAFALQWLLDAFFVPNASRVIRYAARLDKDRKPVEIQTSMKEVWTLTEDMEMGTLPCRVICHHDEEFLVTLDHRIKTDFMSVLKMIKKKAPLSTQYDKHGFTFVVRNNLEADRVAQGIRTGLQQRGCVIIEDFLEQPVGGVIDKTNPDTDPDFRARRLVFSIAGGVHGVIVVELNIQSLGDKIIATTSYSAANHDWYSVRRFHGTYLPWRYSWFVYGIDWRKNSQDWRRIAGWIRVRQQWKS